MSRFPLVVATLCIVGIVCLMLVPLPPFVVDVGISISIALAVWTLVVALFVDRPVKFSSFPVILLASLVLRLALNISSTRLIISDGYQGVSAAGSVIESFSIVIMGNDIFVGITVFCVLLIVNFIVITKGASRMAEVGARFALDGMPGKQLAIDSDLSAGAISHDEAKTRREVEQAETSFFGSLDGASKFVKGDAIAGLLIVLINIVVGLIVGVIVHDMSVYDAFSTYSKLTVGDGLVSQFPAVVLSIAAAILLARGGSDTSLTHTLSQLFVFPSALAIVCFILFGFALLPFLPFYPFFIAGSIFLFLRLYFRPASKLEAETEVEFIEEQQPDRFGDVLSVDELKIDFAADLISVVVDQGDGLELRINKLREHVAATFGLLLPDVRLSDSPELGLGEYRIVLQDAEVARGQVFPGKSLVLSSGSLSDLPQGVDCLEPVYGAQGRWVDRSEHEKTALLGHTLVSPIEVVATHVLEVVKSNLDKLLTRRCLNSILFEMRNASDSQTAAENSRVIDDIIPEKVPFELFHSVLRLLLSEHVSIRNIPLILEAIAEARTLTTQPEQICEHVRQRLAFQIVSQIPISGEDFPVLQLSPEWEDIFSTHEVDDGKAISVALPPEAFSSLLTSMKSSVATLQEDVNRAAIVVNRRRRRFVRDVVRASGLPNPVLSFDELGLSTKSKLVGMIPT